jgi:hypothetical protein
MIVRPIFGSTRHYLDAERGYREGRFVILKILNVALYQSWTRQVKKLEMDV